MPLSSRPTQINQNILKDCLVVTNNYIASCGDRILADTSNGSFTIKLPLFPIEGCKIDIFTNNFSNNFLVIDLNGKNFQGRQPNNTDFVSLKLKNKLGYVSLVYHHVYGWCDYPSNQLSLTGNFALGMKLWLDGSGLSDLSGNENHATPIGSLSPSAVVGVDNQPVLRWNGSGTQELQIPPFLSGTTSATLYVVFTVNSSNNYNLVRTSQLDDYWRFSSDSNGYIGTFLSNRLNAYPAGMPSAGSHLVSIHVDSFGYEVLLNNSSKSYISGNYYSNGDRFGIVTNDKNFIGDIATLLVYPFLIDKSSNSHRQNIQNFKNLYPSLSLL